MIYRELDPDLYTVDGQYLEGAQEPHDTELETIGAQVVTACSMYNFAVIENTFATSALKTLQQQAVEAVMSHDAAGRMRQYNTPKASGIHKTSERHTDFSAESQELLQGLTHGIYRASAGTPKMDTLNGAINTVFVTRYAPGGRASAHYDETSGVALETTLEGTVNVNVRVGLRGLARVSLGPNATLIMPGQTFESRGRVDQAKHSVRNATPTSENNGYRLGITYIYGRLSAEERAAWLQSHRRRGTIK